MAVNRCGHFVHVLQRRSLLTSNGIKCLLASHLSRASLATNDKQTHVGNANPSLPVTTNLYSEQTLGSNSSNQKEEDEYRKYEDSIKMKILQASLPFVHNYGWSKDAISAGAESLGYPGVAHGMFPRGGAELIQHFYVQCNQQLVEILKAEVESKSRDQVVETQGQSPGGPTVSTKTPNDPKVVIAYAVETRLKMIEPYISHWPQALAIMTLPPNVPTSLANLLTLVDDIWYYAGDKSVDFNWYTRRVALAGIYKMTELYMIQDGSLEHQATWTFLNRRIDEATQLHSLFVQSESAAQFAKDIASSTFITARNMLGLNWNR